MRRTIILILVLFCTAGSVVAQVPPNEAAHGAEKQAHAVEQPESPEAHGHAAPKSYFGIPGWILKLVNMIVFFGFLGWLMAGPVKKSFGERRARIQAELQEARARREKADRLAHDIDARLLQLEQDVSQILERATVEGERQKQEIIEAAHSEAERILANARSEVDARVKMARTELAHLAGDLATDRATKLLEQRLTDEDRRRTFQESLGELEGAKS